MFVTLSMHRTAAGGQIVRELLAAARADHQGSDRRRRMCGSVTHIPSKHVLIVCARGER